MNTTKDPDARATGIRNEPIWERCIRALSKAMAFVGAGAAIVMAIHVIVDVTGRFFFNSPLPGTLDFVSYWWMPMVCLLPLAFAELKREHIGVSLLTERTHGITRVIVLWFGIVLALVASAALSFYSFEMAFEKFQSNEHALGANWLPIWPMRFVVAIAFGVWALELVRMISRLIRGADQPADEAAIDHDLTAESEPAA